MILNSYLNQHKILLSATKLSVSNLVKMIKIIENGIISLKQGELIFHKIIIEDLDPTQIIKELNLSQISDIDQLKPMIEQLITDHPEMVQQYAQRSERVMKFFVGQVMKASRGKANPKIVSDIITKILTK